MEATEALAHWGAYDRDDPFPLFADVRGLGAVHPVVLADGHDAWLVIGHEEARAALGDPHLSKDMHAAMAADPGVAAEGLPGPTFARHMLAVDPPDHTRLRRLVSSVFTARTVEGLRPRIQGVVDDLLDSLALAGSERRVDLIAGFAFPLPFTVICEMLGVPTGDRASLGRDLRAMLVPTSTPEDHARAKAASDSVVAQLEALVARKRAEPGDDLVTGLLAARDGGQRLSRQELMSSVFQLFVAGHDTTTSLIGNAVVALLRHPAQLAKVRADPGRIDDAVDECLRFDAPVPHATFRYATEPVALGGRTIPAGAQVIVCLAGANRDPARYADPDRFDIDRDEGRHLAFGHGIHHCLGLPLARLEGRLALGSLFARYPRIGLAPDGGGLRWAHGDGLVLRGLSALEVVLSPAAADGRRR